MNTRQPIRSARFIWILVVASLLLTSCGMLNNLFKRKSGCPSNGKNVGAEQILSGDPKSMKQVRQAKKFRS